MVPLAFGSSWIPNASWEPHGGLPAQAAPEFTPLSETLTTAKLAEQTPLGAGEHIDVEEVPAHPVIVSI